MATLADLKLPDIGSASFDAKDGKIIKDYLYQLNEQLRYLLGNIEPDQLSNDTQEQLNLSRYLIDALSGGGTTINVTNQQSPDMSKIMEQIQKIGDRLGEGSTSSGAALNVVSVDKVPSDPKPGTIYLIRGVSVLV